MKNFLRKIILAVLIAVVLFTMTSMSPAQEEPSSFGCERTVEKPSEETKINYSNEIHVLVTPEQREKIQKQVDDLEEEIEMLAKVIYREARGQSLDGQAAVVWCVLNRVDADGYGDTIKKVITSPNQFAWYPNTPVWDEHIEMATDVVTRWLLEKEGFKEVGRVLPNDYLFFGGDGKQNWFRQKFKSNGIFWDWSLESPY